MSDAAIRGHVSIPSLDAGSRLHSSFWRQWTASVGGLDEMRKGNLGSYLFDDFHGFDGTVTTNVGTYNSGLGRYQSFEDTGSAIVLLATEDYGVIRMTNTTTDNLAAALQFGSDTDVLWAMSDADGERGVSLFECRIRTDTIANTIAGLYIGMAQEGLADANDDLNTDAGALADIDYVGFKSVEADGDTLDFITRKNGQAETVILADAVTLVADTWTKIGFAYVPDHPDGARVIGYQDGVAFGTVIDASTFAATFPDAEELSPIFGVKQASTTVRQLDIDWWAAGQILI